MRVNKVFYLVAALAITVTAVALLGSVEAVRWFQARRRRRKVRAL